MNVLVVNAGSSSLKYQLFNTTTNEVYLEYLLTVLVLWPLRYPSPQILKFAQF